MKKKAISLILAGCLILSLTACKKTPEAIVIQKDADRLEEQARQEATGNSLRDIAENLPEKYTWENVNEEGTVSISADASIQVPDLDAMPSYSIEARVFTQEDADRMIDLFFPGEEVYDTLSIVYGKDYYLEQILFIQEEIATGVDFLGLAINDSYRESLEECIAYMQEEYEAAPEQTTQPEPSSRRLEEDLCICDLDNRQSFVLADGGSNEQFAYFTYTDRRDLPFWASYDLSHGVELLPGQPLPPEAANVSMSYEDAKALALSTFGTLDENLVLDRAYLMDNAIEEGFQYNDHGIQAGLPQAADHWAYCFYFVRQIDGIPIHSSQALADADKEYNQYAVRWCDEIAYVMIDGDGIFMLNWDCPLEIKEKLSDSSSLVPFQESTQIFENIVSAQYRGTTVSMYDDDVTPCEVTVTRVSLELIRVRSGAERKGLLVPAWVYYGTVVRRRDKDLIYGKPVTEIRGYTMPVAIGAINAIDGTYIATDNIVL